MAAEAASEATSSPSGGAEEAKERPRFTVTVTPPDKPAGTGGGAGGAASGGPSGSEARVPVPRGTDVEAAAAACEKLCRLPSPEERRPEGGDGNTGEGFDVNLVYGEVPVRTLANILYNSLCACPEALLDPEKTSRRAFVDLGSGRGQAVLAASMLYPTVLSEARGIEVVPALHAASEEAASAAPKRARSEDVDLPPVSFTHGSFLDSDDKWPEEAIVAFCNSSALDLPCVISCPPVDAPELSDEMPFFPQCTGLKRDWQGERRGCGLAVCSFRPRHRSKLIYLRRWCAQRCR